MDFGAEEALRALERDRRIVDAAFFLLAFGQIEWLVNLIAVERIEREEARAALRQQPFERGLNLALRANEHRRAKEEIAAWYDLRNRASHGQSIAREFNMPAVLQRAQELEAQLPVP